MLLRRLALGAASGGRRRLSCTTNTNHKPAPPRTARGARPPAPRVPVGDRRSLVADRPSAIGPGSRSFVRPVEDEDGCAGRCVCMCACVYTCARLPPFNHVIAQSYDITLRARALTTRTLRRVPAASSRVDDEQQPRPTGVQHSAADGRTRRSEQESHLRRRSPERHLRTANRGGWRVEMRFQASVRRSRGGSENNGNMIVSTAFVV